MGALQILASPRGSPILRMQNKNSNNRQRDIRCSQRGCNYKWYFCTISESHQRGAAINGALVSIKGDRLRCFSIVQPQRRPVAENPRVDDMV